MIKMFETSSESIVLFLSSVFYVLYHLKMITSRECPKIMETKSSPIPEADYSKEKGLFNELFLNERTNINITPDLYCCDSSLKNIPEDDWNTVETKWKSRILFHNTVQGNVIMYYDIYKLAFVYYSDMQISYKWLNYCAMKYVRIFYCRDFFLDDSFFPANFENPFNQKKSKEDKEELQKKEDKKKTMEIDFQSDVFLKRREKPNKKLKEENKPLKTRHCAGKCVNNFRYMGKLVNFSFLKTPEKEVKITKNYQYIEYKKKLKQDAQNTTRW